MGRPQGESVFTRERHAIVAAGADGGDIVGEGRGRAGQPKGVGKGVGMSQLPAQCERAIGSTGGPIRIAAMPEHPGQLDKGADADVLPVAKGGIAMLIGPIQRRGRFEMGEGCRVIAAPHQRMSEDAMADQVRAGRGLRLGDRQEVGGVLERGRNRPSVVVRDPKPEKHGEMEGAMQMQALQALKGVGPIVAATIIAEVGDFSRFAHPRQLVAYFGLAPGEHSSGTTVRPRGITKAGSSIARTVLCEAAWNYRTTPKVGQWMKERCPPVPQNITALAWKAQLRLHKTYRRLILECCGFDTISFSRQRPDGQPMESSQLVDRV